MKVQRDVRRAGKFFRFFGFVSSILLPLGGTPSAADLAVVIDDVGYSIEKGTRAINLPGRVTLGILPFAPHTQDLARYAMRRKQDVIVHQPMEPHPGPHVRKEHGTLTLHMPPQQFAATLAAALDAVPESIGVSNHTGSLLTQHRAPMEHLMREIERRGLFFLDSRTTAETIALEVAREHGIPALRRDVFLDHHKTPAAIHASFELALSVARQQGYAVIIAHPYEMSLDYLERRLANLPADISLVRAADLARLPDTTATTTRPAVLAQKQGPASLHISPGQ